jgi:outer membrane protein OmpA-like peptidoglycan-associated protein
MARMKYLLAIVAIALSFSNTALSQVKYGIFAKAKHKLAKQKMDEFDFRGATTVYLDILADQKYAKDTLALRRISWCYMSIGNYTEAEKHLVTLTQQSTARATDYHNLAEVYKILKKYPQALDTYKRIVLLDPNDELARLYANKPDFASSILRDSSLYVIQNAAINSPQSDFSPGFFANGKIIFSSSRGLGAGGDRLYNWTQQPYLNIYTADITTDSTLTNAQVLSDDVNSKFHEGTVSFDANAQTMYFTRNNAVRGNVTKAKSGRLYLGIYTSTYNPAGTWGKTERFKHNNKEWSVGHPTITPSGNRLFFVSDKPGGYGGTDIYYCIADSGSWSAPKNAGPRINTPSNEGFPFALNEETLYFASEGHVGLGGYDLFYINTTDSTAEANNMGYPINTHFDDFALITFPKESRGFFSSNRSGGKGDDDIYIYSIHPPDSVLVSGLVVDEKTKLPIASSLITVQNEDGSLLQVTTDENGKYEIKVPYKPIIRVVAEKKDYEPGFAEVTTNPRGLDYKAPDIALKKIDFIASGKVVYDIDGAPAEGAVVRLKDSQGMVIDSTLVIADGSYRIALQNDQKYKLEVYKTEYVLLTKEINTMPGSPKNIVNDFRLFKLEKGTVVRLDNIYYDYGKFNIRPDAALELNKLVQILRDNPTMKIELSSHTDARGSDSYNLKLSDNRAKSAVEYLISQGIASERLIAKGYGETKLLNQCGNNVKCTEEEHQFNRRTEFTILDI